jgi:hypothetical protein
MACDESSGRVSRPRIGFRGFCDHDGGTIAIKLALLLPFLLLMIGNVVDQASFLHQRSVLQSAADAAALAAAKELSLTDTRSESLAAVAQSVVTNYMKNRTSAAGQATPVVATTISSDPIEVRVSVSSGFEPRFGNVLGITGASLEGQSVARIIGKPNICLLGLNPNELGTISLEQNARVTGQDCAVYSNSSHNNGLKSKQSAQLSANFICTRGGKDGGPGSFIPEPLVDCPSFDDPLGDRPEPFVAACDPLMPKEISADTELSPGTYCGLTIRNGARVTLRDGIYVIRDGMLVVTDGASLIGKGAGLYFTGPNAAFTFDRLSTISLEAPTSGPMAGLLVFTSRSQSDALIYSILSDDARVLVGTIYVPKGELRIDATTPIADKSAYTAIVADKMRLYGGPHLVLNTNYDLTDVPVPKGIRGTGQPAKLMH